VNLLVGFLENLGISKVVIIGHGLGAIIGMKLSAKNPTYVDRILLTSYPLSYSAINQRLMSASISELTDWLLSRLSVTESVRTEAIKADKNAIVASLRELSADESLGFISNVNTSSIIVYGQNDPVIVTPTQETIENLPEQTHCILFEQSGHFPMLEEPSKYNRLLFDFLSLNSGESPKDLQLKDEWKRRVR
jgi:pimeloyl-ACP methyl ester carboxylesterase